MPARLAKLDLSGLVRSVHPSPSPEPNDGVSVIDDETEDVAWAFSAEGQRWGEQGFSREEAHEWDQFVQSPDEAAAWRDAGFTATDAPWAEAMQGDLEQAQEWRDSGFSITEVGKWHKVTDNASSATEWRDAGFTPEEADEWRLTHEVSEMAYICQAWRDAGFTATDAAAWRDAVERIGPDMDIAAEADWAKQWRDLVGTPDQMIVWCDAGFPNPSDAEPWVKSGAGPDEASPDGTPPDTL